MYSCDLKTPLYSNFALPWRCDIMEYSSLQNLKQVGVLCTVPLASVMNNITGLHTACHFARFVYSLSRSNEGPTEQ